MIHPFIASMRKLLECPKVNTYAALRLAIRITHEDDDLWDQLGFWTGERWIV